jgi:hypothetical protein
MVGGIAGGGQPWSTREGEVLVELDSGSVEFEVRGLVLAGGNTIGTPGRLPKSREHLSADPARPARPSLIPRLCR